MFKVYLPGGVSSPTGMLVVGEVTGPGVKQVIKRVTAMLKL
jgi:hypothetical protein